MHQPKQWWKEPSHFLHIMVMTGVNKKDSGKKEWHIKKLTGLNWEQIIHLELKINQNTIMEVHLWPSYQLIWLANFPFTICIRHVLVLWRNWWQFGQEGEKGRSRQTMMSIGQVDIVSTKLLDLQRCIPSCFARKPWSLRHLERWKATELRQFLVYTGKLVLPGVLRQDLYEHFLTLSVAISILLCLSLVSQHVLYAHKGRELYGPSFMVYNVHSMLHLASDATTYGCLDECSAFPYENYMQQLKRMVCSGKSPVQIVKRIKEIHDGTTSQSIQKGNVISSKQPDNCIIFGRWQMLLGHR